MNASLREKEHWSKPVESQNLSLETPSKNIENNHDGAVNVINILLNDLIGGMRRLWRKFFSGVSMFRRDLHEARIREERTRILREEIWRSMRMKM